MSENNRLFFMRNGDEDFPIEMSSEVLCDDLVPDISNESEIPKFFVNGELKNKELNCLTTIDCESRDMYNSLFRFDLANRPYFGEIYMEKYVIEQCRWHRKKRINKKWLKRYGFKEGTIKMILHNISIEKEFDYKEENNRYISSMNNEKFNFNFNCDDATIVLSPMQKRRNYVFYAKKT